MAAVFSIVMLVFDENMFNEHIIIENLSLFCVSRIYLFLFLLVAIFVRTFFLLKSLVCLAISWLATGHDDLEESEMFIPNTCDRNPKLEARTTLRILTGSKNYPKNPDPSYGNTRP